MILVTAGQAAFFTGRFQAEMKVADAQATVRRLARLTFEIFQGQEPPAGGSLWQAIGKPAPMIDPWGQEYRMEVLPGQYYREYIWQSAGKDHAFGSRDDLRARVPYSHENAPDVTQPEMNSENGNGSTGAL